MKFLLAAFMIVLSPKGFSKVNDYKCDYVWKTLSENASFLNRPLTQKISEEMNVAIKTDEKMASLTIKESYKDNKKNFIEYNFSCDKNLSCQGARTNVVDGKKETVKIEVLNTSGYGLGRIGSRELFQYKHLLNGFSFEYIVYKNDAAEPMGLKASCRSSK